LLAASLALGALSPIDATRAWADGIDLSKGGPIQVTSRDGIEWRQAQQEVIARGDARAVRGDDQVMADTLIAHYRKKATTTAATATAPMAPAATTPKTPAPTATSPLGGDTGNNEIYRLEADGHVKIFNQTDIAVGDHAIYDMDQAVLLMTGKDLKLTTPNQVMTARDSMEYWSQKHMAVGRGLATVTTSDGRRLSADVLVGYTAPAQGAAPAAQTVAAKHAGAPSNDPIANSGKLQRVEAFGHVEVRTATETITGERAVYVADPGIARVVGNVVITRGLNRGVGDEAIINMNTGVSRLIRYPGRRVEGLIVPSQTDKGAAAAPKPTKPTRR
jgi:lipopolysaccharide export system protein LptA